MSGRKPPSSHRPGDANYEVGYGKPPTGSRFRKGQSGNPAGRRKGSKNRIPAMQDERLKTIILEEAYRNIRVREGEKTVSLPVIRAAVRTMANKGLKGETRSLNRFLEMVGLVEDQRYKLYSEYLQTMIKLKHDLEEERETQKRLGIKNAPELFPNPDDILIDYNTGTVEIRGPFTREDIPKWKKVRRHIHDLGEMIRELEMGVGFAEGREDNPELLEELRERHRELVERLGPGTPPKLPKLK